MTLEQQIEATEVELKTCEGSKFKDGDMIKWLKAVLESLHKLKNLEK